MGLPRWGAILGVLVTLAPAAGQGDFVACRGLTAEEFKAWTARVRAAHPAVALNAYATAEGPRFAAVATAGGAGETWEVRQNLARADFKRIAEGLAAKGFRPVSVSAYPDGGSVRLAGTFVRGDKKKSQVRTGLTTAEFRKALDQAKRDGMRPAWLSGCPAGRSHQLAVVFEESVETPWVAKVDLTGPEYQHMFNTRPKDFRPLTVCAYPSGGQTLYAACFVHAPDAKWSARHNLTSETCEQEVELRKGDGFRPACISGYLDAGKLRYAVVWVEGGAAAANEPAKPAPAALPMTGRAVESLRPMEDAMQRFMRERDIPAGALAVSRQGVLLYARGFGWRDPLRRQLAPPDMPFRLASVTKPITAAAVRALVAAGLLTWDLRVFPYLAVPTPPGGRRDPRLDRITVQHLLDHQGGWDRGAAFDPMFRSVAIAKDLGVPAPTSARDVVRYMAGQPLQFDPGAKRVYSNFGYCVLGRVIEKASGMSYAQFVQAKVMRPVGAGSIELGRTLPRFRNAAEPSYFADGRLRNVFDPSGPTVAAPDGGWHLEAMDAHGGLIGSAPDLTKFLDAYWINGEPRRGGSATRTHFGSLDGTWTVVHQRADGVNFAALFNRRGDGASYGRILAMLNAAADAVRDWPTEAVDGKPPPRN